MENDINALMKQPKKLKSNLTHEEDVAMVELAKRKNLILTNGTVVAIMDTDSYIKEVMIFISSLEIVNVVLPDPNIFL